MVANFDKPTVDTTYTAFPTEIIENIDAALQQLSTELIPSGQSHTNIPDGAIKWDYENNKWVKKVSGSFNDHLSDTYNFTNIEATLLQMGDSNNAQGSSNAILLGNTLDLRIFHDGSNSYIRDFNGTGNLKITTNQLEILSNGLSEVMAKFIENGSVELYENNQKRIETTTAGATITGALTTTGAINTQGGNLNLSNTSGSNSIEVGLGQTGNNFAFIDFIGDATHTDFGLRLIRGQATNQGPNTLSQLIHRGTGQLQLVAQDAGKIALKTNGSTRMFINENGQISVGSTNPQKQFEVASSGTTDVIIRSSAASSQDAILRLRGSRTGGGTEINNLIFETNDTGGGNYASGSRLGKIICGKQSSNTTRGFFEFRLNNDTITDGSLGTNTSVKMHIKSSSECGLGTTNPQRLLELASADQTSIIRLHSSDGSISNTERIGMIEFSGSDSNNSGIGAYMEAIASGNNGQTDLRFATGTAGTPVEAARFDKDGRLLIGHTAQRNSRVGTANFQPEIQIHGDSQGAMSITRYSNSTASGRLHIQSSRGTADTPLVAADGDSLCDFSMSGFDGTNFTNGAKIVANINGTVGSNAMPTDLKFQLRDDGGDLNTNLTMTHDRFFGIIKTSPTVPLHVKQLTDNNGCARFEDPVDGNTHVTIDVTDSLTSFTARRNANHGSIRFQSDNGTATSENMRIITNTGVVIGTTTLHTNDKLSVTGGRISTSSFVIAGRGNGGVALTHNDGGGNSNLCFNHVNQTPEQNGKSGRIDVNADNTGGVAIMKFGLKHDSASGTAGATTTTLQLKRGSEADLGVGSGTTVREQVVFRQGTTTFPTLSFESDTDTGISRSSGNRMSFITQATERVRINNSGLTVMNNGQAVAINTAKVWINFNGEGTVGIRDSYNVDSLTDLGTGYYRINFSITFANNDYCFCSMIRANTHGFGAMDAEDLATDSIEVRSWSGSGLADRNILGGAVFGDV
tara:strand:- start:1464 stop:4379 length:2916 start_codon:yes stop_codon:yes gene_type:complete